MPRPSRTLYRMSNALFASHPYIYRFPSLTFPSKLPSMPHLFSFSHSSQPFHPSPSPHRLSFTSLVFPCPSPPITARHPVPCPSSTHPHPSPTPPSLTNGLHAVEAEEIKMEVCRGVVPSRCSPETITPDEGLPKTDTHTHHPLPLTSLPSPLTPLSSPPPHPSPLPSSLSFTIFYISFFFFFILVFSFFQFLFSFTSTHKLEQVE